MPRIALLRTRIPNVALSSMASPEDWSAVLGFRDEVRRDVTPAEFSDAASLITALSTGGEKAIRKRRDEGGSPRPAAGDGWYWPAAWDFSAFLASKRPLFTGRDWLFSEIETWFGRVSPAVMAVYSHLRRKALDEAATALEPDEASTTTPPSAPPRPTLRGGHVTCHVTPRLKAGASYSIS